VRALHVLDDQAAAGGTECLDRKEFALLHLGLIAVFDDGHTLAGVNVVGANRVPVEVANRLDLHNNYMKIG
jgi:hypothetical protein